MKFTEQTIRETREWFSDQYCKNQAAKDAALQGKFDIIQEFIKRAIALQTGELHRAKI